MDHLRQAGGEGSSAGEHLLGASDPVAVRDTGDALAPGPFVLVADHAGAAIPAALERLGLDDLDLTRHIAFDIGSAALAQAMAERLQAPLVQQVYSRLVIDCNRDPADPTAVPQESDHTAISGNRGLSAPARRARVDEVHEPYHAHIDALLEARRQAGLESVLVSMHSFTPELNGFARPWEVGVLHDGREDSFALAVLAALREEGRFTIGDNQPYQMDATDYCVPRHAYPRGLRYVEIEVRQDLLPARSEEIAALLAATFTRCV